jgi:hypothetical protein
VGWALSKCLVGISIHESTDIEFLGTREHQIDINVEVFVAYYTSHEVQKLGVVEEVKPGELEAFRLQILVHFLLKHRVEMNQVLKDY